MCEKHQKEVELLQCPVRHSNHTTTSRISAVLQSGVQRCFNSPRPTEDEINSIIWRGLPPKPSLTESRIHEGWLLQLAAIHDSVNMHDWKHRGSCFKGGK